MVMPAGMIAFSPEFEKIKSDLKNARNRYISLVEEYNHLINVTGKNLENEYMLKIGKKEHELFSCQVEILRIKREISIFQAARNRGETVTEEAVKKIIETEFSQYQEQLKAQQEKLKQAQEYLSSRPFTEEETKAFKKLYHDIVRKLHPDLNPNLPEGAAALWKKVQEAYKNNFWNEMAILADLIDELLEGKKDYIESINSMVQIKEELEKIQQKINDLESKISDTNKRIPFSYKELLQDPIQISSKRRKLDKQIKLYKNHIEELKIIRAQF